MVLLKIIIVLLLLALVSGYAGPSFHPCFGGTTESVFRFIRLSGPGIGNSQGVEKRGIAEGNLRIF